MPWFEDVKIGTRMELGSHTFTEDEIIAFATSIPKPRKTAPSAH
jgi:hypothetical protein